MTTKWYSLEEKSRKISEAGMYMPHNSSLVGRRVGPEERKRSYPQRSPDDSIYDGPLALREVSRVGFFV